MKTISAPAGLDGAPLAELKQWLAITTSGEDALLIDLLAAAHAMCERFVGFAPFKCEVRETLSVWPREQDLRVQPVWGFAEATAVGPAGDRLLTEAEAQFERVGPDGGRLVLKTHIPEPRIVARYYAGLSDDWSRIDEGLRHGIIRYAAHQYRQREEPEAAGPPAAVAALWRPYRRMRL